jgi:hypothetical protein
VPLTFVVGTGRCGSTLLSRLLHLHPEVLSVSEFFTGLTDGWRDFSLPAHDMDGQEFWELVSAPTVYIDALIQAGLTMPELCYPYGTGRFQPRTGVPAISQGTLPMLTDDPDALFDQLAAVVRRWPRRSAADQYTALFTLLADVLGRRVMVERSGSTIVAVPVLRELFPDARFVHMHRAGPDCALSMSRHVMGRIGMLTVEARLQAGLPDDAGWQDLLAVLPARFRGLLVPPFDRDRFLAHPMSMTSFGELWAELERIGLAALRELPAGDWMSLSYEGVLHDHARELTRIAEFIGVPATTSWLAAAGAFIDPSKSGSAEAQLGPAELSVLRAACAPGTQAIAESLSPAGPRTS